MKAADCPQTLSAASWTLLKSHLGQLGRGSGMMLQGSPERKSVSCMVVEARSPFRFLERWSNGELQLPTRSSSGELELDWDSGGDINAILGLVEIFEQTQLYKSHFLTCGVNK